MQNSQNPPESRFLEYKKNNNPAFNAGAKGFLYKHLLKIFPALCFIFIIFNVTTAGQNSGNTTADFLQMAADPDSIALGNTILALNTSPAGIISNPAALAYDYQPKLSFTNTLFANDVRYTFAGIAVPLKLGALGIAASSINYGQIQGYDASFVPYNIPDSEETAAVLNYAIPLRKEVPALTEYGSAGLSVKFVHLNLAGYAADVMALDLGGTFNMPFIAQGVSAGVVLRNSGNAVTYNQTQEQLPTSLNFAVRYDLPEWKEFFTVIDAQSEQDNLYYSAGAGLSPIYPLTLRCGWRTAGDESAATGLSLGFGLNFSNFSLRYSMSQMKDISLVHTVLLDIKFESFSNTKVAYNHYLERYYELGRDKYKEQDYIAARQIFEDILSVYPGHTPSKEYLLKINSALDEIEQGQQVQADRWLRKADVALARDDVIKARKYYALVMNIDSGNAEAVTGMNKIRELLGDYENTEAEELNKNRITNLWNNAVDSYSKGDYVVAREKFQDVLRIDPNNEEAARYLSEIYSQLNRISSTQTNELFTKGVELFGQGNYSEAKKYFSAIVITNPDRQDAKDYVAACEQKIQDEQQKAQAETQKESTDKIAFKNVAIKNNIESAYFSALKIYQRGEYEDAIKAFTKCMEVAQNNDFKKYAESSKNYLNASKKALAEKYYKLGNDAVKNNKLESAIENYNQALEYNPDLSPAKDALDKVNDTLAQNYYEMGMKAFSSGDTEKAKELFKKSLDYKFDKTESLRALERMQ